MVETQRRKTIIFLKKTSHSLAAQPLLRLVVLEYYRVMHHKRLNYVRQIFHRLHLIVVVQKETVLMYLLLVLDDEHLWEGHVFWLNWEYVVADPSMYLKGERRRRRRRMVVAAVMKVADFAVVGWMVLLLDGDEDGDCCCCCCRGCCSSFFSSFFVSSLSSSSPFYFSLCLVQSFHPTLLVSIQI